MVFSFRYKSVKLLSGKRIFRPMIPLTIGGREKIDVIAMLDSGSDITIIPKEIAEILDLDFGDYNEISGISGAPVKAREAKLRIHFGKGHERYSFLIPILVPEKEGISIIIGRMGFFNQFKITFSEEEKKLIFKRFGIIDKFKLKAF